MHSIDLAVAQHRCTLLSSHAMTLLARCRPVRVARYALRGVTIAVTVVGVAALMMPMARADNKRINDSVAANVYTVQHQVGCTNDVKVNLRLQLAAQWHTDDLMNNRSLVGDIGSDGSTPQDRAAAAGFHGKAAETIAINPALAINNMDILNQWYYNPADFAIISDCANTAIGVWSANSLDRSVVVAVYGQPA